MLHHSGQRLESFTKRQGAIPASLIFHLAMSPSNISYDRPANTPSHGVKEEQIEYGFIRKLPGLKYENRPDIRDRAALERNFREKFEALNLSLIHI